MKYFAVILAFFVAVSSSTAQFFPSPPRHLEGSFNGTLVALQWHHPETDSTPSFYKVYRHSEMMSPPIVIGTTNDTTYNDTSIALHKEYHYMVTAVYHAMIESPPSNIIEVSTNSDTLHDSSRVMIHFTSLPPHFVLVGQQYQYTPTVVTMPPGIPVCFNLEHGPGGMTINESTGEIQWTPTTPGIFGVELKARACDGRPEEAEQEFVIFVMTSSPASVQGIVQNTAGQGLPNVIIKLFDVGFGAFVMRTETDDSGHYRFPFVNPSTYYVRARPENELYLPQWYDGASRIEDATPVIVPESSSVTVNFTLQPRDTAIDHFVLSGTVFDQASNPISGAHVAVFRLEHDRSDDDMFDDHRCDRDDPDRVARTDSSGHYSFVLRRGTYIVGARAEGFLPQFWNHKPSPLDADRIILSQDTSDINFDMVPRIAGTGSISGTIRNAADSSGLRSHVLGFHKDSTGHFTGFVASSRSDSTGAYTLDHLPNGSYLVLALAKDDFVPTFYNLTGGTPFLDSATAVPVTGGAVSGIDIYVQPDSVDGLNSIVGIIESQIPSTQPKAARIPNSTYPVVGALVTISDANHHTVASTTSQSDGSYIASGLAPGSYMVTFQKPGMLSISSPASVSYVNNTPSSVTLNAQMSSVGETGQFTTMSVQRRWNLVSVPVTVSDFRREAIFPSATSQAYRYTPESGYQIASTLEYGAGYWLKFPSASVIAVVGAPRTAQTINVIPGWNLIGSLANSISASSITSNPPGMVTSQFFGYNRTYAGVNSLEPGKGYWVKVNQAGSLTLSSSAAPSGAAKSGTTIRIVPTSELPPPPPDGESETMVVPKEYSLAQNYPNPFNPTTDLRFGIRDLSQVTLTVYDVLGREIATLVNEVKEPGEYTVRFDASLYTSGVYYYRLTAGSFTDIKKMVLMK